MKKLLLSALCLMGVGAASAQTIVSTSAMNRAPVLEEFTGVNCQFCPDGHKIAQQLKDQYSNAVLINVHAGGYANTTPYYGTVVGENIDDFAVPAGYPAGSVNRDNTISGTVINGTYAMYRNYWSTAFTVMNNESSPVNVAVEPTYDENSNEVSILVEVYYTGNTDSSDYLNVFLLQSNVKGPQVAAATYYPEMMYADGQYNHNHMLRHSLTGTDEWGLALPAMGAGDFWDTTIVYTLPTAYGPVAVKWEDMEVAAFVADEDFGIYSGNSAWFIPADKIWDMSTTSSNTSGDGFCTDETVVSINVKNDGASAIGSFDITYSVNGGATQTESYSGTLAPNATTPVEITVSLNPGVNNIVFNKLSNVKDGNGDDLFNPTASGFLGKPDDITLIYVESDLPAPIKYDFESDLVGSDPAGLYKAESVGGWPIVVNQTYATWMESAMGGHGKSENSIWAGTGYASIPQGSVLSLITDNYDFSEFLDAKLKFSWAHASLNAADASSFHIDISTDCGETWDLDVWTKAGTALNTAGIDAASIVRPYADGDWDDADVDLTDYAGEPSVMARFRYIDDAGNSFYLDDIKTSGTPVGVAEKGDVVVEMFPNPANDVLNFSGLTELTNVTIVDMSGRTVMTTTINGNSVDVSALPTGVYSVTVENSTVSQMEKLTIVK